MLHEPNTDEVFWEDARRALRSDQRRERFIAIPKGQTFSPLQRSAIFAGCGAAYGRLAEPLDVLRTLAGAKSPNASFPLSYLDIFLEGLTDIGRKLFFSMGMCLDLAEGRTEPGMPVGIGGPEFVFVDGYVQFLVSEALAHVDYSDFLIDLIDRQMVSTFLVPLTSRGRKVRDLCRTRGATGSSSEITEWPVGLIKDRGYFSRQKANFGVADRLRTNLELQD